MLSQNSAAPIPLQATILIGIILLSRKWWAVQDLNLRPSVCMVL
jgi:hypothetical protein